MFVSLCQLIIRLVRVFIPRLHFSTVEKLGIGSEGPPQAPLVLLAWWLVVWDMWIEYQMEWKGKAKEELMELVNE